jgi:prepilin-type N-terminal cleavage/methylation domain-containing protein
MKRARLVKLKDRRPLRARHSATASGFTIIELMIATAVFAVILLVITVGVLSFTKSYTRGTNASKTQDVARRALTDIAQNIKFSGGDVAALSGANGGYCVGTTRYSFVTGYQLAQSDFGSGHKTPHVLVRDSGNTCTSEHAQPLRGATHSLAAGSTELLSPHMRLTQLNISKLGSSSQAYKVTIGVAYGDDDLLTARTGSHVHCKIQTGSQFCAVSNLSTTVVQRLKANP